MELGSKLRIVSESETEATVRTWDPSPRSGRAGIRGRRPGESPRKSRDLSCGPFRTRSPSPCSGGPRSGAGGPGPSPCPGSHLQGGRLGPERTAVWGAAALARQAEIPVRAEGPRPSPNPEPSCGPGLGCIHIWVLVRGLTRVGATVQFRVPVQARPRLRIRVRARVRGSGGGTHPDRPRSEPRSWGLTTCSDPELSAWTGVGARDRVRVRGLVRAVVRVRHRVRGAAAAEYLCGLPPSPRQQWRHLSDQPRAALGAAPASVSKSKAKSTCPYPGGEPWSAPRPVAVAVARPVPPGSWQREPQ